MSSISFLVVVVMAIAVAVLVLVTTATFMAAWYDHHHHPAAIEPPKEGFQQSISMANSSNTALALIDTVVKGSFHSAYDGKEVTLAQLRTVLARGVRWVDFDILADTATARPVIGVATKPVTAPPPPVAAGTAPANPGSGDPPNAASNTLPLTSVLNELSTAAFSPTGSPNAGDPLFVNLRIKTNNSGVYPGIASALGNAFGSALHTGGRIRPQQIDLASLMGRVVFVLDTQNSAPAFAQRCDDSYASCAAVKQVRSLAALLCGTANFPLSIAPKQMLAARQPVLPSDPAGEDIGGSGTTTTNNTNPVLAARGLAATDTRMKPSNMNGVVARDTSATRWRCTIPDPGAPINGNVAELIEGWGIQVTPQCFWKDDTALAAYERLFQELGGGAACMALSSAVVAAAAAK